MRFPKEPLEEPKLIVIPIVDVLLAVFLFLAIIAFKTPFVSVFVQLPHGVGKEANLKILTVIIDKRGKIIVGKRVLDIQQLKALLRKKKPFVVNVMADKETPYRYVAEVLSVFQREGITNVNLILKRK